MSSLGHNPESTPKATNQLNYKTYNQPAATSPKSETCEQEGWSSGTQAHPGIAISLDAE